MGRNDNRRSLIGPENVRVFEGVFFQGAQVGDGVSAASVRGHQRGWDIIRGLARRRSLSGLVSDGWRGAVQGSYS